MHNFLIASAIAGGAFWLLLSILEWMPGWLLFLFIGAALVLDANKKR